MRREAKALVRALLFGLDGQAGKQAIEHALERRCLALGRGQTKVLDAQSVASERAEAQARLGAGAADQVQVHLREHHAGQLPAVQLRAIARTAVLQVAAKQRHGQGRTANAMGESMNLRRLVRTQSVLLAQVVEHPVDGGRNVVGRDVIHRARQFGALQDGAGAVLEEPYVKTLLVQPRGQIGVAVLRLQLFGDERQGGLRKSIQQQNGFESTHAVLVLRHRHARMWIANQAQPNPLFWLPARKWDVERVKHVGFHAAPAAGPLRIGHAQGRKLSGPGGDAFDLVGAGNRRRDGARVGVQLRRPVCRIVRQTKIPQPGLEQESEHPQRVTRQRDQGIGRVAAKPQLRRMQTGHVDQVQAQAAASHQAPLSIKHPDVHLGQRHPDVGAAKSRQPLSR